MEVHQEGSSWEELTDFDLPQTLNLLDLLNGVRASLGSAELNTGHYTQMRLILEESTDEPVSQDLNILDKTHPFYNYVIDSDDNQIFLKVSSHEIKLINGFDIENNASTDIILDFDAHNAIHAHPAGKTDTWRLRPTIKVVEIDNSVSGLVDAGEDDSGAWVSAQVYDETPGVDFKVEVVRVAGSISEEDGKYFMFLPINTSDSPYNIVATKTVYDLNDAEVVVDVYEPKCKSLASTASAKYTGVDFTLTLADKIGEVSGSIVGLPVPADPEDDYSVYLSIRKFVDCDGNDEPETWIEVESIPPFVNVDGSVIPYGPITLPGEGEYEIVAWADGAGTLPPFDIIIDENGLEIQYIDLEEEIDFGF